MDKNTKPLWISNPKPNRINGIKVGAKVYDITNSIQRAHCINELVIRVYLNSNKFTKIAKMKNIQPQELKDYIYGLSKEEIENDFDAVCKKVENEIVKYGKITIYIEYGENNVLGEFSNLSRNYKENEKEINKIIIQIFKFVKVLEYNHIVHGDLKPSNFLFSERNGKYRKLILNDFDTSFVLNKTSSFKTINTPAFTPCYPAPEFVRMYGNKVSSKTDVFVAGLIAYKLLNEDKYPSELENFLNEHSEDEIYLLKSNYFEEIQNGNIRISPPKNGNEELKKIILKTLIVDPAKRPTADTVVKELKKCIRKKQIEESGEEMKNKIKKLNNINGNDNINIDVGCNSGKIIVNNRKKKFKNGIISMFSFIFITVIVLAVILALIFAKNIPFLNGTVVETTNPTISEISNDITEITSVTTSGYIEAEVNEESEYYTYNGMATVTEVPINVENDLLEIRKGFNSEHCSIYKREDFEVIKMNGLEYYNGISLNGECHYPNNAGITYNINGYQAISFMLGHVDDTYYQEEFELKVYLDNTLYNFDKPYVIKNNDNPIQIEIPIDGKETIRFEGIVNITSKYLLTDFKIY